MPSGKSRDPYAIRKNRIQPGQNGFSSAQRVGRTAAVPPSMTTRGQVDHRVDGEWKDFRISLVDSKIRHVRWLDADSSMSWGRPSSLNHDSRGGARHDRHGSQHRGSRIHLRRPGSLASPSPSRAPPAVAFYASATKRDWIFPARSERNSTDATPKGVRSREGATIGRGGVIRRWSRTESACSTARRW